MKIIVLGAGQVGATVAESLAHEFNDITVVDADADRLAALGARLDIRTVTGQAAHPEVLEQAGAGDADMVIAVTNSDEINMVACQVAYTLFHTPTKIARVRSAAYLNQPRLFQQEAIPIDVRISPEQLVTEYVLRLIERPGALQVLDFADGRVQMVALQVGSEADMVGAPLRQLHRLLPKVDVRVVAIYRRGAPVPPDGDTRIQAEDEVFLIAAREHIRPVMATLRSTDAPVRRIVIAGGGNIGQRLAASLEHRYQIKLIEFDTARASHLGQTLQHTVVIEGDACDTDLLLNENVDRADLFCALTNDEEVNILAAMQAKRLGTKRVISLISRPAYIDLVQTEVIDIAVSPQQATIGSLLTFVRRGDVVAVHALRRGVAEAIEAVAHGDITTSRVVGRALAQLELPPNTSVGAIVRGDRVLIAHHDVVIETGDHVVLFLADKAYVPAVEQLFQVAVTFL